MSYVFAVILALLISAIMSYLEMNSSAIFFVTFLVVFAGLIYPTYRTLLWETKVEKIEKFLLKKRKGPTYHFIYSLANEHDEEAAVALNMLLKRYKQPSKQALYKTMYALYKKDLSTAKEVIELIKPDLYKSYYKTGLLIEEGKYSEARQLAQQISKPWMKNAVFAEIEKKQGNSEQAIQFARLALTEAKGLNRYSLHKAYERDFPNKLT